LLCLADAEIRTGDAPGNYFNPLALPLTLADVNDTIAHNTLLNVLITTTSGVCN
jgi:hypothetical protein